MGDIVSGIGLGIFGTWLWHQPLKGIFWLKFLLETKL